MCLHFLLINVFSAASSYAGPQNFFSSVKFIAVQILFPRVFLCSHPVDGFVIFEVVVHCTLLCIFTGKLCPVVNGHGRILHTKFENSLFRQSKDGDTRLCRYYFAKIVVNLRSFSTSSSTLNLFSTISNSVIFLKVTYMSITVTTWMPN